MGCWSFRGPTTCTGGHCLCQPGLCVSAAGVCTNTTKLKSCQDDTGGTCHHVGCYKWRGPTKCVGGRCLCAKGFCADASGSGQCAPPDATCNRNTGSSCEVMNCYKFQGAQCEEGTCMCKIGDCPFPFPFGLKICMSAGRVSFLHDGLQPLIVMGGLFFGFGTFFWCGCIPWTASVCIVYYLIKYLRSKMAADSPTEKQ